MTTADKSSIGGIPKVSSTKPLIGGGTKPLIGGGTKPLIGGSTRPLIGGKKEPYKPPINPLSQGAP